MTDMTSEKINNLRKQFEYIREIDGTPCLLDEDIELILNTFDKFEAYENADLVKRSEAIETVANIGSFYDEEGRSVDDYDDKAEIVSDWFSHIPRFEPKKEDTDLIERSKVIEEIEKRMPYQDTEFDGGMMEAVNIIRDIPRFEPTKGRNNNE